MSETYTKLVAVENDTKYKVGQTIEYSGEECVIINIIMMWGAVHISDVAATLHVDNGRFTRAIKLNESGEILVHGPIVPVELYSKNYRAREVTETDTFINYEDREFEA